MHVASFPITFAVRQGHHVQTCVHCVIQACFKSKSTPEGLKGHTQISCRFKHLILTKGIDQSLCASWKRPNNLGSPYLIIIITIRLTVHYYTIARNCSMQVHYFLCDWWAPSLLMVENSMPSVLINSHCGTLGSVCVCVHVVCVGWGLVAAASFDSQVMELSFFLFQIKIVHPTPPPSLHSFLPGSVCHFKRAYKFCKMVTTLLKSL